MIQLKVFDEQGSKSYTINLAYDCLCITDDDGKMKEMSVNVLYPAIDKYFKET